MITQERLKELLTYHDDSGLFTRNMNRGKYLKDSIAGNLSKDGYITIKLEGKVYPAHRLVWLYKHGTMPINEIDHINHNRADNRLENLRDVNRAINQQNKTEAHSNNKHGFLGVSFDIRANKWYARINHKYLGIFNTAEEAHECYLNAKRQLHEGCTI